ncbi:MAG TPA: chaperone modulator CbpM [Burkholderiales bacterium]|nr:chaperone modulator CbpM [Burkholderiales bacterium]
MSSRFDHQALFTEHLEVALEELAQASGLLPDEIVELVEYGVLQPVGGNSIEGGGISAWRFSARAIVLGRRASRLKADFDLNVSGLALVLTYLERIEEMEAELARLRCQLLG